MQNSTAAYFDNLNRLHIKEIIGNYIIDIEPVAFCTFDKVVPTNGQHLHNCFELCIVTGGTGKFLHGNNSYILKEGDVFIADPKVFHEICILNGNASGTNNSLNLIFFNINIHGHIVTKAIGYEEKMILRFLNDHKTVAKNQFQILSYLDFIKHYKRYPALDDYGIKKIVKTLALESLFLLISDSEKSNEDNMIPTDSIIDKATLYIGSHLSENLYLKDIARHVTTSVRNLQHLFQKHLKKTVTEYIKERRLAIAAGYLKMNFMVSNVCSLVGINDPARFSRLFKQFYGISPKKYQMLHSSSGMIYGTSYPRGQASKKV